MKKRKPDDVEAERLQEIADRKAAFEAEQKKRADEDAELDKQLKNIFFKQDADAS